MAIALTILFAQGCTKESTKPTNGGWVWNRNTPLTTQETDTLQSSGIKRIYWQRAEIAKQEGAWKITRSFQSPSIEHIAVIRLAASPETVDTPADFPSLAELIKSIGTEDIQIDYDCPDRLLQNYAQLLRNIREAISPQRLSITALGGWAGHPGFADLQNQVEEIAVMFYDLSPDMPEAVTSGSVQAMVDLATIQRLIPLWQSHCKKPWFAGLPNFSRLSVFGENGALAGHLHDWNWDALIFHPDLEITAPEPANGITWLKAKTPIIIAENTPIHPGQKIILRQPDSASLKTAEQLAIDAGCAGIVWFPLPTPDAGTGFSPAHLSSFKSSSELTLTYSATAFTLTNTGTTDLPPRFVGTGGKQDRGRQLEIDVIDGGFFDAALGEFVQLLGHVNADTPSQALAPVGRARRLTFWFSRLTAGHAIQTGPAHLRSGTSLRWRVDGKSWQEIRIP